MKISRDEHNHLMLGQNYDINLLRMVTKEITSKFKGKVLKKLNGIDTAYWDIVIGEILITVHYEHYLGIIIMPHSFFGKDKKLEGIVIEKENALIKEIEDHFSKNFAHILTN